MPRQKQAVESRSSTEAFGDSKARGSSSAADITTARLKTPRTRTRLPPVEVAFGNGGEKKPGTDLAAASKIKSRTMAGMSPIRPLSGSKQGRLVGAGLQPTEKALADTCQKLRELQRRKVAALKARIAIDNQLTALVAIEMGYSAGLEEKERKVLWTQARKLIGDIADGNGAGDVSNRVGGVVHATLMSRDGFEAYLGNIEKDMVKLAKTLPVVGWCEEVRGFGLLSLAAIVGECGNIGEYRGPASLWKRLGLAPIKSRGITMMPSTWRTKGGLSAEEWTEAGYSPRRRSIMYVIGECLVKQNKGEFRQRYDESKASAHERHEDWTDGHCHNHAMLLAVKRLVKRLWQKWRGQEGDILTVEVALPQVPSVPASGKATASSPKKLVEPFHKSRQPMEALPKNLAEAATEKARIVAPPKQLPPSRVHRLAKVITPPNRVSPAVAKRRTAIQRRLPSFAKIK